MFTFTLPHKLGAYEAKRRVLAALQNAAADDHFKETSWNYDAASKTFTLNVLAYGRPAKAVLVFGDSDVKVTVEDEAGWFIDKFIVEPKLKHKLAEILA